MKVRSRRSPPAHRSLLTRLDAWMQQRQRRAIDAWLGQSQNVAELEARIRDLNCGVAHPFC